MTHARSLTLALLAVVLYLPGCAKHWQKLPQPPERSDSVTDIGVDAGGTLWMMAGTGVFVWNGERFAKIHEPDLSAGVQRQLPFPFSDN